MVILRRIKERVSWVNLKPMMWTMMDIKLWFRTILSSIGLLECLPCPSKPMCRHQYEVPSTVLRKLWTIEIFDTPPDGHIWFFHFIKIAQGWELHTPSGVVVGTPNINNLQRKNLISQNKDWQKLPLWLPDYHIWFFHFIKIAQGWELHTHSGIVVGTPNINNLQRKKNLINQNKVNPSGWQTINSVWQSLNHFFSQKQKYIC